MPASLRKFFIVIALLSLYGGHAGNAMSAAPESGTVALVVDGRRLEPDVPPHIVSGRTLVPARIIAEALGAGVSWDPVSARVRVLLGEQDIILSPGRQTALVNGREVALDVPAQIIAGRTLVPLRFVGEALGVSVGWDPVRRQVAINRIRELQSISYEEVEGRGRLAIRLSGLTEFVVDSPPSGVRLLSSRSPGSVLEGGAGVARGVAPRIVINLPQTMVAPDLAGVNINRGGVRTVRAGVLPGAEPLTRLVIDFEGPLMWEVGPGDEPGLLVVALGAQLTAIEYREGQRLFLALTGPVTPRLEAPADQNRLVIELPGATPAAGVDVDALDPAGPFRSLDIGTYEQGTRVVAELAEPAGYHVESLPGGVLVTPVDKRGESPDQRASTTETAARGVLSGRVIGLDPGHGGDDPGAIGPGGTYEKDITLALALRVRDLLTEAGARVVMTREEDRWVGLYDRAGVVNEAGADVFVSIHLNAAPSGNISGVEIYRHPAGEAAFARALHQRMLDATGLPNRGLVAADFVVLRETRMPGALLECAYLSNPREEQLIKTEDFQERVAGAIFEALRDVLGAGDSAGE